MFSYIGNNNVFTDFPISYTHAGSVFFYWIALVAIAFVYNALGIFFRSAFDLHDKEKKLIPLWLVLDYVCDIIYLADIVAVQFHLSYSDRGLLVVWADHNH